MISRAKTCLFTLAVVSITLETGCGDDAPTTRCTDCGPARDAAGEVCTSTLDACNAEQTLLTHLAMCIDAFGKCFAEARRAASTCFTACGDPSRADEEKCRADCSESLGKCRSDAYIEENRCKVDDCPAGTNPCSEACEATSAATWDQCFQDDLGMCSAACER